MSALPPVTLAEATSADMELFARWIRELRRDDPMPAETLADDAAALRSLAELMADDRLGKSWVIYRGGVPVGYAVLTFVHSIEFGGRCAFLDELYVEPANRGQGVGRRTLELLELAAARNGVRVLLLEASPDNARACRLYASAGFGGRKYRLMSKRLVTE